MSGHSLDENDEFDEQLRMRELYGGPEDGDTEKDPGGENDSFRQQPTDTPYEWDLDKKAWSPETTEDFIAPYQANYGFSNDGASSSTANVQDVSAGTAEEPPQRKSPEPSDTKKRGEKRKGESGWFHPDESRDTNVYVSGLPPDITVDEFIQLMSTSGMVMTDPQTGEFKVKLFKDNQGNLQGDGLCCYLKRESVELALKFLDDDEIRGYKLHVEVAEFQLKGAYDASKKKKKCRDHKEKLSMQQKQLHWRPERRAGPSRMRHERDVVIRNMFHPCTSQTNVREAATEMEFEEPTEAKKFEKTEDGGELEEESSEKDAQESGPEKEAEEGCPQKDSEESCLERASEEGCPKRPREDDSPDRESGERSPEKEREEGSPEKESKENGADGEPKKKRLKTDPDENGLEKGLEEEGSAKGLNANIPEKEVEETNSEKSEFAGDSSEKGFDEECSEKGFHKESDEKEEGSDERGTVGDSGNVKEGGPLSTGSSFVLSSDDEDEEDDDV
ncbi:HIV Tat-specific factor [Pontoporia blainvillei]|uniref:HIV Tat-specific factor n=1 Tax=Pontoporia blainvillei TaxID=48723 RepID=A0ABX0S4Z4_PONBL|nr:HIV Tat-specific factor [Pontoporia blainvillei]